ncbi:MAG TPA: RNA polymerase sigma factor [Puia sp.]|nr:RNA polymerase sigma factor [Puia sp.]
MKSYEALYGRYADAMYQTCIRMVANKADADDLLQDSFFYAFTNLDKLKNSDAFGGWLKRIVINKSTNFIKRDKAKWDRVKSDEDILAEPEPDNRSFIYSAELLEKALSSLPDHYRSVISLHVLEQLSFEKIALLFEVPSSTIRTWYRRGKQETIQFCQNSRYEY